MRPVGADGSLAGPQPAANTACTATTSLTVAGGCWQTEPHVEIMNTNLDGKVILITGASGGLGSAMARAFAAEGARLVLHYHSRRAEAERLAGELGRVETLVSGADLRDEAQVRALFAEAAPAFRPR